MFDYCNENPVNGLDPDGRCVEGAGTAVYDMGTGVVKLGGNILGSTAYAATSGFGMFQNEYSDNFSGSWQGLQNTWSGLKYLGSQALNGNFMQVGVTLTGGEGRSAGFRTGYAGMSVLAMALGGEFGEAGEVSEVAGDIEKVTVKGLNNPFIEQTPSQIDAMFKAKGFEPRGPDPLNGKGGYINPINGRSYHIDAENSFGEPAHVDVNRLKSYNGSLDKKKYFIGE